MWGLKQEILQRMLLPMGEMTKPGARALAAARGFEKAATKKDSLGVCFCPMDYRSFLKQYLGHNSAPIKVEKGKFIGQRRGLGIDLNRAVFVKEIHPVENTVVLSSLQGLAKTEMWLKDWNMVDESRLIGPEDIIVKIRYRKQENHCKVQITEKGLLYIHLYEPLTAIAPGQAAAFYKDGLLLGGGIIVDSK